MTPKPEKLNQISAKREMELTKRAQKQVETHELAILDSDPENETASKNAKKFIHIKKNINPVYSLSESTRTLNEATALQQIEELFGDNNLTNEENQMKFLIIFDLIKKASDEYSDDDYSSPEFVS